MGCVPVSGFFQAGKFIIQGYTSMIPPPTTPDNTEIDHRMMHCGTLCKLHPTTIAQAIWDGQAILATDGSVQTDNATYAWILSTTNDTIGQDVTGGGLLPPRATYQVQASKRLEAAALYAALKWISLMLEKYPDHTTTAGTTPALPIPVDNQPVIDDIRRPVSDLSPMFMMLRKVYHGRLRVVEKELYT